MSTAPPFSLSPPPTWDVCPFGRIVNRSQESGRPEARSLSVFIDQGVVPRDSRDDNFNRLGADLAKYLVVRKGDIVFNRLRTWQGGLGVSKFDGIVSPAYFVCRPQANSEPRYMHYLLRSHLYLKELTRISKWMPPSQFDIAWDDLRSLNVLVPSFDTQSLIANYLDWETGRIDEVVSARRRMIGLLEERAVAFIEDSAFNAGWRTVMLGRVIRHIEQGWSPQCDARPPTENEWGVLKVGCVNHGEFRRDEAKALPAGIAPRPEYLVRSGDFLMSRANTRDLVGSAAVAYRVRSQTLLCDKLYRLRLDKSQVTPRFVALWLQTRAARDQIELEATGASDSMQNIGQDTVRRVVIPLPDLHRQEAFVVRCERERVHIGKLIGSIRTQIDLLQERRQALITAAVTGRLEIPDAA